MKTVLTLLLFVIAISCHAQDNYKGKIVAYLDQYEMPVSEKSNAAYFRTVESNGDNYVIRNYHMSGELEMESLCSRYAPTIDFIGRKVNFHKNGNVSAEVNYVSGIKQGSFKTYYEDGQKREESFYVDNEDYKRRFDHYYSIDGTDQLVNGNGIAIEKKSFGDLHYIVKDSYAVGNFNIDGQDSVYLMVEKQAEFKGGLNKLGQFIGYSLVYPKSARRSGAQGNVFVAFIVRKDGGVTDAYVVKGFDADCDNEALRVVRSMKKWNPGTVANRPVDSRFVLPVRFKLEG